MDGVNSETLNLFIQRAPLLETPNRRVQLKNAFGVSGGVPFDEQAYENTEMQLLMFVDGKDKNKDREKVDSLLRNTGVFKEFVPYFDPTKTYYVMANQGIKYESPNWYEERQALEVIFTVKPYKYLRGVSDVTFTSSTNLTNPFINDVSQPIITIIGTGDATLRVNGVDYRVRNIDAQITIDSERYLTYKKNPSGLIVNANEKYLQKNYPIFSPGVNSINVTGSGVTQVRIEPRWRSLS